MHWLSVPTLLVIGHTIANFVWIGSLLSVAVLARRAHLSADPVDVGTLARRVHTALAAPAFLASLAAGVGRLALEPRLYLHMPWMHAKLALALGVIALHHSIGARARRLADGHVRAGKGLGALAVVTFMCASGAVLLGIAKSLPMLQLHVVSR